MAHTFRPDKATSTRSVPADATDRKRLNENFRERKANQERIKTERFAAIEARRKAGRGGPGAGINIDVTSDD